ncbi:MAG: VOC family protein [Cyanobacteria bacterium P01_D01_bin.156]
MSELRIQTVFVTLAGENLSELVAFYQEFFGQLPDVYSPDRYAEFKLPGCKLALFRPSTGHCEEFLGTAASMSLCLEVVDLDAAIATLTTLGYPPPGQVIQASHGQEIYAYDPAGNRLILHQASPSD